MNKEVPLEELYSIAFEIIAEVGDARSKYVSAINEARNGRIEEARALIAEGAEAFSRGHEAHAKLIQGEACGIPTNMNLMLTHAEDQLMSAESFGILAEAFVDVYLKIDASIKREGAVDF